MIVPESRTTTQRFVRLITAALLLIALSWPAAADAQAPPLPPKRPLDLVTPLGGPSAPQKDQPGATVTPSECVAHLREIGVDAEPLPPLKNAADPCHVEDPIRLKSIRALDSSAIPVRGTPLIDCRLAIPLSEWLGGIVAPVMKASFSARLSAVRAPGGYECRNRNRAAQGKISAHAQGLALDIDGFELADGRYVPVTPGEDPKSNMVVQTVRTAACGWFWTVLGPGSDAEHATHLHVDIQQHGKSDLYRICE